MVQPVSRTMICKYYLKTLRLGELASAAQIEPYIAEGAVVRWGDESFEGRDAVVRQITGRWPTYVTSRPGVEMLRKGGFSEPVEQADGTFEITAEYPRWIVRKIIPRLTIRFNDQDQIVEINHEVTNPADPPKKTDKIPTIVRGIVADALANGTPMSVAYVDANNRPVLSMRGSLTFYSETQICAWLRHAEGNMVAGLAKNPGIALLYWDPARLVGLVIEGDARIDDDETVRRDVYDLATEIEQLHDPERNGAALIIDIKTVKGNLPSGAVSVEL